jgi:two-component system sensor histidine kinase NreB
VKQKVSKSTAGHGIQQGGTKKVSKSSNLFVAWLLWDKQQTDKKLYRSEQTLKAQQSRLARDLHDNFCQRLGIFAFEVQEILDNISKPSRDNDVEKKLQGLLKELSELNKDVRRMSRSLHPAKLERWGLKKALEEHCAEMSQKFQISVQCDMRDIPNRLPLDISECLFRVTQEALSNAAKYSKSEWVCVEVKERENSVYLSIRDEGIGFEVEGPASESGLGLMSMRERVELIGGTFFLTSLPNRGTRIDIWVPSPTAVSRSQSSQMHRRMCT